jgi:hypothetical protein
MADTTDKTEKPDNSRNKAYGAATTRLRDAHRDEFNTLLEEEYKALGLTPRRRRTAEEIEAEKEAKAQVKAEQAERKRQEKIAKLQAEIDALVGPDEVDEDDVIAEIFGEPVSV